MRLDTTLYACGTGRHLKIQMYRSRLVVIILNTKYSGHLRCILVVFIRYKILLMYAWTYDNNAHVQQQIVVIFVFILYVRIHQQYICIYVCVCVFVFVFVFINNN